MPWDFIPAFVHGGNLPPDLGDSVETSAGVEVLHAVESPDDVDFKSYNGCAVVGSGPCWVNFLYLNKL